MKKRMRYWKLLILYQTKRQWLILRKWKEEDEEEMKWAVKHGCIKYLLQRLRESGSLLPKGPDILACKQDAM